MLPLHPSMTIPNPTPEGVAKFKALYRERMGEELDDDRALELATRYLHFVFFGVSTPPMRGGTEPEQMDGAIHRDEPAPTRDASGRRSGNRNSCSRAKV